ncbi:MAG TPA: AraC family transcriptional regulator [Gemmatimonadales bacterium]|nr:AraC family transcriptional regulator [Gemmatimonadales bacterium]
MAGGLSRIAAEVEEAVRRRVALGLPGRAVGTVLASGDGWWVEDVICTSGPDDRSFEERHDGISIAVVLAGTFQYRSAAGREMLTPGSLLLGNHGQCFECDHEHATGDRCAAFHFVPGWFERLAADVGARPARQWFGRARVPPLREISPVSAGTAAAVLGRPTTAWEELALDVAARALRAAGGRPARPGGTPRGTQARVTDVVRAIERDPGARLPLTGLAARAGLSPFHFLRTFRRVTGVTPHQFILRARLRDAATRLATRPGRVSDIAYDAGFGDLSTFNRAFRAEFGMSPVAFRASGRRPDAARTA